MGLVKFTSADVMFKEVAKTGFSVLTGAGIALAGLLAWTGADDLQAIKEGVNSYITNSERSVSALASDYWGVVDSANAEIGEYKDALDKANGNITKLVDEYQKQKTELANLQKQLKEQYVSVNEANEIIAKANEEINAANEAVKATSTEVNGKLATSQLNIDKRQALNNAKESEYRTGDLDYLQIDGDKTVQDISSIVPTEQPTEQPTEEPQE